MRIKNCKYCGDDCCTGGCEEKRLDEKRKTMTKTNKNMKITSVSIKKPKKLKAIWKPDLLEESRNIGYMEGYYDSRTDFIKILENCKLLPKNWREVYSEHIKKNFLTKDKVG
jgi:hypothetical protein